MAGETTPKYHFGIVTTPKHESWLVQSASVTGSAQEALALDGKGEPVVAHYYQNIDERTLEVIIPLNSDSTLPDVPEIGKVVKYGTEAYYVSAVSQTETNTDFLRYSITMKRFTKAGKIPEGETEPTGLPLMSDAGASDSI